jgi:thiaminase/transcriptional activator TenA
MAELVAALLPCAWGYAYIGERLARAAPPADQRYADWIIQYASEEFQEASRWLQAEMDRLSMGATSEKRARLEELFVLSSRYEWQFWEMCWHGEEWSV